ncbi:metallophosphoesterase [Candidatus Marinimicrobia bacterium]|nr:metallophosphoesterase [Candidatus Neomarinimicrobiota bacterium]
MKKLYLLLIFYPIFVFGQGQNSLLEEAFLKNSSLKRFLAVSDGPYIFIEKNKFIEKQIVNGMVFTKTIKTGSFERTYIPEKANFNNIKKIAALSDIHGQYDLVIKLFKNNKIIDDNLNWSFGKGHLVITGDIFDRGDKVNEVLWFIYKLESQAKNKGGRVHYLLGNHEYMILYNDLRYIHEKYKAASILLNLEHHELYSDKTIIGKWLRSKSTIIKINNNIFTHGGISEDFISYGDFNIEKINDTMRKSIPQLKKLRESRNEVKSDSIFYNVFYGNKSLIWYRDYFKENFTDTDISKILKLVDADHIVVGHTTQEKVVSLFNNKILGVDSGLKNGEYGEVLIIEDKRFFRGTLNGKLIELVSD